MIRIKRISFFFRLFFQFIFIAMPILLVFAWMTSPDSIVMLYGVINMSFVPRPYMATADHASAILHALTVQERLTGFCLSAVQMAFEMFVVYSLIKLFKLYEQGEIFSTEHVRRIRNIGFALLIIELFNPIYQGLMGIVLTLHNPPGHRFAAITLDQTNVGIILIALLVILISWIMAEGYRLSEEQQLTI